MNEILIYSGIYNFTAAAVIEAFNQAHGPVTMRINSPGGSVFSGYGIIAKMKEYAAKGNKLNVKVDGMAMSMAANICLFADNVECLDVTKFMFHAGSYSGDGDLTEDEINFMAQINSDLKAKMTEKVNSEKLKELKGISIDELYTTKKDLYLTAEEAKQLGIVQKITKLQPSEMTALEEKYYKIAALAAGGGNSDNQQQSNQNNMTLEKFKAEHPEVFAQIVTLGVKQERARVQAIMQFIEVDAKQVKEIVDKGEELTQAQIIELTRKEFSAKSLEKIEAGNPEKVLTAAEKEAAEKEQAVVATESKSFWDNINKFNNIKLS